MGDVLHPIDSERCTECVGFFNDPQCAPVCPNGVPGPDPEHKETKDAPLAKKNRLHP
jgi:ferredoxin